MTEVLAGRRIALGVTGSIAAYKALTLASHLAQAGALVDAILTPSATELVRPLAFQALTHRPVVSSLWEPAGAMALDHVAIARGSDVLVIAPATANSLARLALGLADDALTTTALACRAPWVLAPAMEPRMWSHPATQAHVATLLARGARMVGPESGRMASGQLGVGRMTEPELILEHVRLVLAAGGPLAGRRVLVTAGPTREPLDPVRFLTNHSSGHMGLAVARQARDRGAAVTMVHGPICLAPPLGVAAVPVETAAQMREAVLSAAMDADAVIMTAAVADYRPAQPAAGKIKKAAAAMSLQLAPNPDILMDLDRQLADAGRPPCRVGFAAETENLLAHAMEKRQRKGLDLIVANPVPDSFGDGLSAATLVHAGGVEDLPPCRKDEVAAAILDWVQAWLESRPRA